MLLTFHNPIPTIPYSSTQEMPMMLHSTRSMSSLPDKPKALREQGTTDALPLKPFFIMDWLEDLAADQDLETISKLLHTPSKSLSSPQMMRNRNGEDPTTPKSSNRKKKIASLFQTSRSCPAFLGDRSRSTSPVRPRQLLFGSGGWGGGSEKDAPHVRPAPLKRKKSRARSPHSIYRKSIALGDAWNAKGLGKAQKGLWQEALICWDNSLEIRIQMLGQNHLDVANTFNNRGIGLGKLGQYGPALESLEQALKIRWHLFQQHGHSSDTATSSSSSMLSPKEADQKAVDAILSTLHNIANVHQQAGDWEQALNVFGQARELGRHQRQEHPHTVLLSSSSMIPLARICVAMGHVYYQAEQWMDAREAYRDAADYYRIERTRQHMQPQHAVGSDDWEAAILACQQELTDVERDLADLDHRLVRQYTPTKHHHNENCIGTGSKILMLSPSSPMGRPCEYHHFSSAHY